MKTLIQISRWLLLLVLLTAATGVWAQPFNQNPTQTVCPGNQPYYVDPGNTGNTFQWNIVPAGGWTLVPGADAWHISVTWANPATPTTYTISVSETSPGPNSCSISQSISVTVNPAPSLTINSPSAVCSGLTVDLTAPAITAGSTLPVPPNLTYWTDAGATFPLANPNAVAVSGTYYIMSTTGTAPACSDIKPVVVTINPLPVVAFTGTYGPYCVSAGDVTLAATPAGGTFSGTGVSGNQFNPATAGIGSHIITYDYTDGNGCANSTTTTIVVNSLPTLAFTGTYGPYCISAAAVTLVATPAGGTFAGNGVSGSLFTPATAGVGSHVITYTYSDGNSCTNSTTVNIVVNDLPVVAFTGSYGPYCVSEGAVALAATPVGGTFSGNGVSGTQFIPATAGPGSHIITYTYTDGNTCTNSTTTTIIVNDLPVVAFTGSYGPYCVSAAAVTLAATPAGGTFSGTGITGNQFNPGTAGLGSHVITYTYTDGNTCTNSTTTTIVVNDLPAVAFTGTYGPYCVSAAAVTLIATPVGGTFSGNGVSGNQFIPSTAGVGSHVITYTYSDGNTCTNSTAITIIVNDLPVVAFSGSYGPYCVSAGLVTLVATPVGGTFAGNGVNGAQFDPATAGVGSHVITYTYSDGNNCTNSTTTTIVVNDLPVVTFTGTYGPYCVSAGAVTLAATPVGGTFSGNGVSGNQFIPATAGIGSHVITYTYSDGNTCTNSTTTTIIVNDLPVVAFTGTYGPYCVSEGLVTLAATPVGGTFSGNGVSGTQFNPATAGVGSHVITYTYSDGNTCTNSTAITIIVNDLPVVAFTGSYGPYCVSAEAVALVATPVGGTFSGNGVSGTQFNPATAGAGSHVITYTYSDANGCSNSTTITIVVNPLPVVTITPVASLCVNAVAVTLSGSPFGGTFSGPGVSGNQFDPAIAGVGAHIITYSYTDGNNCSNSATTTVTVTSAPTTSLIWHN